MNIGKFGLSKRLISVGIVYLAEEPVFTTEWRWSDSAERIQETSANAYQPYGGTVVYHTYLDHLPYLEGTTKVTCVSRISDCACERYIRVLERSSCMRKNA